MTNNRPRDSQRSKLYAAELVLDQVPAGRGWNLATDGKAGEGVSHRAVQVYVDWLCKQRFFQARWGQRQIPVHWKTYGNATGYYGSHIVLPPWARNERVTLHEIAHVLDPSRGHGPEYAGVFLTLVRCVLGDDVGRSLRESFRKHRVRVSMANVPKPDPSQVVTAADERDHATRAKVSPVHRDNVEAAAGVLRRLVNQGHFGASGRKTREHALEVARRLEEMVRVGPGIISAADADRLRPAVRQEAGRIPS